MKKINRRKFLENSALLGGAMFLPACATAPKKLGANEKMNVALIGVGGIGKLSIAKLRNAKRARFAAFCDVDDVRAAPGYNEFPKVPRFTDFRRMLDKMDKEIDGVVISTPDHMHYPISAWALKMGKHVYCQKPLTRTIWEARQLNKIANETGLITQMGNQGHTFDGWRVIKEWYDAGILGKIENIYSWTDRPINFWKQGLLN
ncbi:MAG: Gfo/Idh/MocA family oxidoreductase, partial [Opitutales bacterium]|nr:Gfo/Idh/MocA family oxidoreductase [Opitutales bacterium]